MKINNQILSLPPYISTKWSSVFALYTKDNILVISLADGEIVEIPDLSPPLLQAIFVAHAAYMELELMHSKSPLTFTGENGGEGNPVHFNLSTLDGFGAALQHNPNQANAPDIPAEILSKISAIAKIVTPDEASLPKGEPHCNCMFCQIARAVHVDEPTKIEESVPTEEIVAEDELKFQDWVIAPKGDKLFSVTNKLDTNESYTVYLGEPVGCTCGITGCQHLLAVLRE